MPHLRLNMEEMRADISQARPHMLHVRADLPQVQLDMEQMCTAVILFTANRLCSRNKGVKLNTLGLTIRGIGFIHEEYLQC